MQYLSRQLLPSCIHQKQFDYPPPSTDIPLPIILSRWHHTLTQTWPGDCLISFVSVTTSTSQHPSISPNLLGYSPHGHPTASVHVAEHLRISIVFLQWLLPDTKSLGLLTLRTSHCLHLAASASANLARGVSKRRLSCSDFLTGIQHFHPNLPIARISYRNGYSLNG